MGIIKRAFNKIFGKKDHRLSMVQAVKMAETQKKSIEEQNTKLERSSIYSKHRSRKNSFRPKDRESHELPVFRFGNCTASKPIRY